MIVKVRELPSVVCVDGARQRAKWAQTERVSRPVRQPLEEDRCTAVLYERSRLAGDPGKPGPQPARAARLAVGRGPEKPDQRQAT